MCENVASMPYAAWLQEAAAPPPGIPGRRTLNVVTHPIFVLWVEVCGVDGSGCFLAIYEDVRPVDSRCLPVVVHGDGVPQPLDDAFAAFTVQRRYGDVTTIRED